MDRTFMTNNRIIRLQEEYNKFCLTLLEHVELENVDVKELLGTLLTLQIQIRDELETYLKNYKTEAILAVESEIAKLRTGQPS